MLTALATAKNQNTCNTPEQKINKANPPTLNKNQNTCNTHEQKINKANLSTVSKNKSDCK